MIESRKTFNLFSISEARNVLFGIATLWIGLFHSDYLNLSQITDNQFLNDFFNTFRGFGNVGVDMFLLLSGIGLYFSFTKDRRVLTFWKKRFMRVLPSAFLIATVYVSFRYVNGRFTSGINYFLSRMTFTYFFWKGERVFWFISLILVLYLVFPLFYKIIEKYKFGGMIGLIALVVAFTFAVRFIAPAKYDLWEIALCRVPVFIFGIWMGKFVMEKKQIPKYWLLIFSAIAIGMIALMCCYTPMMKAFVPGYNKDVETMYIFIYRYPGTILGTMLVILDSYVIVALRRRGQCNLLRNFFEFVGMYSMEYYMIYLNINHYLERIYELDRNSKQWMMLYFGSFVVSLVLCVLVRKVCDYFMAYMQRKPKGAEELRAGKNKWYEFLIYFGLFFVIGFSLIWSFMNFYDGYYILGAAFIGVAVLAVFTRNYLAWRKPLGPMLVYILTAVIPVLYLIRESFANELFRTILGGGKKAMLSTFLVLALTAGAVALNVIYFNKRKELFVEQKEAEE